MEGYNQVPHLPLETIWESDKNTWKSDTSETPGVSPFPAGDRNAARNRLNSINNKKDPKWNGPQTKLTEGLDMASGTNLTLSSDVDLDNPWKTIGIFHKV